MGSACASASTYARVPLELLLTANDFAAASNLFRCPQAIRLVNLVNVMQANRVLFFWIIAIREMRREPPSAALVTWLELDGLFYH